MQISFPFLLTTIAIVIIHSSTVVQFGSGLQLSLDHYKNGVILLNVSENPSPDVESFSRLLQKTITSYAGIKVEKLLLNASANIDNGK